MKIKNRDIVNIYRGISAIKEKKLPIKIGFAINRNMSALDSIARSYEDERVKILDQFCEKDESGKYKTNGDEFEISDKNGFSQAMNELLDIENEFQVHTVTFEDIEKCDSEKFDSLSPNDLSVLEFMIEE